MNSLPARMGLFLTPVALLLGASAPVARATVVTIPASKDNTLYESATGAVSNGVGEYFFTGRTKDGFKRHAVIAFDVAAAVPAGSTINSVTLQLHASRVANNTLRVTELHRLLATWGEGTSNAGQNEGQGAPSTTGDATWIHRFYPSTLWASPGGDFDGTASASTGVIGTGTYTWSSPTMTLEVQGWLDNPASNFGWLVRGDESVVETSKRFDSRENGQTASRPALVVDYSLAAGSGACCLPAGDCEVVTSTQCALDGGVYQGDGTGCTPNPCGVTVSLIAAQDNTLYESPTGALSNGAGTKVLTSKNASGLLRRALVRFDLSSIPAGSTIQATTLRLYNAEASNSATVTAHRVSASWGEGTSAATGTEDAGAAPATGDATWIHRFYPSTSWSVAGGSFSATASATATVVGVGDYAWTDPALMADVQQWVDSPATNFGWIVRGKESGAGNALKRFESRQSSDLPHRPRLEILYLAAPPTPVGACCLSDGSCATLSAADCATAGGTYHGDGSSCTLDLCPLTLTAYVDSLPIPGTAVPTSGVAGGAASYDIAITEFSQKLHRDLPPTRLWGYGGTFPGPKIEAAVDQPVSVHWINDLRDAQGNLRTTHYLPVDTCLMGPNVAGSAPRVTVHLHGGHVQPENDGYPENTFLPGEDRTTTYANHQPPAMIWFHDHALGITRLNVMMGLAGLYVLRDATEIALGLPQGADEIPLVVQDRKFHSDGSLDYPATWDEHFFGDKILVNGKVWPYLNVRQGKYRFRMLNGSNSRVYRLALSSGDPFWVIGTDGGMLPAPVRRDTVQITPGERLDVVVDFAGHTAGTEILLGNSATAPYPGNAGEGVVPEVMKFIVTSVAGHVAPLPPTLRPLPAVDESVSVRTRDLQLAKTADGCTGTKWQINGLGWTDITEQPVLGTTEVWRFINRSGVVHPMHMHLLQFRVLDRQPFQEVSGEIVPVGSPVPPDSSEAGWKDTAPVMPHEILRVLASFEDYTGRYPYHCHVLEHEDQEMMRQFEVVSPVAAGPPAARLSFTSGHPNPFASRTAITYELPVAAPVRLAVYDVAGRSVRVLRNGPGTAGPHEVEWDGRDDSGRKLAPGVYWLQLKTGGAALMRKAVIVGR